MAKKSNYGDSSIDLQIGAERIRKRPASMLGSSGLAGARHGFTEIYGNALDEHTAGYGDKLIVTYYKDGSISVRDFGRGVPLGWNDKEHVQNWNWHVIYNELYGGGKYENNQDALREIKDWNTFNAKDYTYLYSVGLNGVGAASTQYTSSFFTVKSYTDGICKSREFIAGVPLVNGEQFDMFSATLKQIKAIPEEIEKTDEPNGTFVHWKPDETVFDDINIGSDWLFERSKEIANVAGIDVTFINEETGETIEIPAGTLNKIVLDSVGDTAVKDEDGNPIVFNIHDFCHGNTVVEGKDFIYVAECDMALTIGKAANSISCFHNSVRMNIGVQYEAVQDAIAHFMRDKAKKRGLKLEADDYKKVFCVALSSFSNYASFRGQTKEGIDDKFIYDLIKNMLYNKLQIEYNKETPSIVEAVEKIFRAAEIRIAAKEYAQHAREVDRIKRERPPQKFVSCDAYEHKEYDKAELWITEGDSAAGSVKSARDKETQAIYPIRGKGLNVEKASISKILENKEIREIFALLGTGMDLKIKGQASFNIKDLKFNKIIIATDADEDGYQIRVLVFLTLYRLAPQLITDGHVYVAETPRFGLKIKGQKPVYVRNDEERDKFLAEHKDEKVHVSRYKGLGEVNADVLRLTTVNAKTRNLIKMTCNFDSTIEKQMIETLFGADKDNNRKQLISSLLGSDIEALQKENELLLSEIEQKDIDDGIEYTEV